jgi:hypothetical protein
VRQAHKAVRAHRVRKEHKDFKARKARKGFKAITETKVIQLGLPALLLPLDMSAVQRMAHPHQVLLPLEISS